MKIMTRKSLAVEQLPGRAIQKAVGRDSASLTDEMTVGFAFYSEASGPMQPHRHAEETVIVLESRDAQVRFGSSPSSLGEAVELQAGDTLHIPAGEWHVFTYGPGGSLDIAFVYGKTQDLRPEENPRPA